MDPENGKLVAKLISDKLSELAPSDAAAFHSRSEDFGNRLETRLAEWQKIAKETGLTGAKVVTYHKTWSYFVKRFGMDIVGYVEPKPGIPPSPKHMESIMARMKSENVRLIIVEPYFDVKLPQKIAEETGARLVILPTTVGAEKGIKTYLDLFDVQIHRLVQAMAGKVQP